MAASAPLIAIAAFGLTSLIFTAHQTLASAQGFYADIKRQARAFDRGPDQIKILPGISPFIASTRVEADRLQEKFHALIQPEISFT